MYRVGLPFWKTAARLGVPIKVRVDVHYDEESSSFWAKSPSLDGLVVAGANLDELREEVISAASELLALQLEDKVAHATTEIRIKDSGICIA